MRITLLSMAFMLGGLAPAIGQETDSLQQPSIVLPPELARVLTDYEEAWSNRNPAGLALLFTGDGFVLPGGRPPIRGRQAIEQYYTGHGGSLSLRALAFATEGSVGFIIGAYASGKGKPDIGKFTLTLRKGEDGTWLIMSDMDNANRRPQQ